MPRRTWIATTAVAGALLLAGCGAGTAGSGTASPAGSTGPATGGSTAAAPAAALKTWTSPLGEVVVTSTGSAVYVFDKDRPGAGASACTGVCANLWPAVTTTSGTPSVSGVTGTLGTIPRDGGVQQLTLDGRPLYTYAGDSPGQVSGEGVMGIWWAVSPSGQAIHQGAAPAAPSSSPSSSSDSGGYSY